MSDLRLPALLTSIQQLLGDARLLAELGQHLTPAGREQLRQAQLIVHQVRLEQRQPLFAAQA